MCDHYRPRLWSASWINISIYLLFLASITFWVWRCPLMPRRWPPFWSSDRTCGRSCYTTRSWWRSPCRSNNIRTCRKCSHFRKGSTVLTGGIREPGKQWIGGFLTTFILVAIFMLICRFSSNFGKRLFWPILWKHISPIDMSIKSAGSH